MANKLTVTTLRPTDGYVDSTSRYSNSTIVYYGDDNLLTFETYKRGVQTDATSDRYTIIPAGMEYRPDLMSNQIYGVPDLWWKILEVNNIFDVFDFKAGTNI